jgi:omega-6 fatty acid desaturase (delta-12 desaturase)
MNGALLAIALAIHATLGLPQALLLYVPTMAVAAGVGVGLFYIHHNFEETYWAHPPAWSHRDASLDGSSYLALPRWLQWFAGHTGIHHVHHLCLRGSLNYRLGESMAAHRPPRAEPAGASRRRSASGSDSWDETQAGSFLRGRASLGSPALRIAWIASGSPHCCSWRLSRARAPSRFA